MKKKIVLGLIIGAFLNMIFISCVAQNKVYHIKSYNDLLWMSQQYKSGKTFKGVFFKLENDINMTKDGKNPNGNKNAIDNWVPIGTKENNFDGVFLGNDKVIRANISKFSKNSTNKGIFGEIATSGKIQNVQVEGLFEQVGNNFGMICGQNKGTVEGCSASGVVKGENVLGGLVGINYGFIVNSEAKVDISAVSKVGGLVGVETKGSKIENSCVHKCSPDKFKSLINSLINSSPKNKNVEQMLKLIENKTNQNEKIKIIGSDNIGGLVGFYENGSDASKNIKNCIVLSDLYKNKEQSTKKTCDVIGVISDESLSNLFFGNIIINNSHKS